MPFPDLPLLSIAPESWRVRRVLLFSTFSSSGWQEHLLRVWGGVPGSWDLAMFTWEWIVTWKIPSCLQKGALKWIALFTMAQLWNHLTCPSTANGVYFHSNFWFSHKEQQTSEENGCDWRPSCKARQLLLRLGQIVSVTYRIFFKVWVQRRGCLGWTMGPTGGG